MKLSKLLEAHQMHYLESKHGGVDHNGEVLGELLASPLNRYTDNAEHALKLIKAVAGKKLDIHSDNIMIRRTSVGPQLVLTDPVHSGTFLDVTYDDDY